MENYSVERLDHLGVVAGTIKDLGLVEFIGYPLKAGQIAIDFLF